MAQPLVFIAGGGIGGLATALTLHQIGVPCQVFDAAEVQFFQPGCPVHYNRPLQVSSDYA